MKYSSWSLKYSRIKALIFVLTLTFLITLSLNGSERAGPKVEEREKRDVNGEYLEWKEVNYIFPKYSNAMVVDLDTGLSFGVQRRAGTHHADVQPLTAGDTGVMKKIYGEEWSWKRRAVLVETGGRQIAGSMNGMPHGGGSIRGNNFPGHFCIHFRGSRLHASGREDPAHRMMVLKAAGMLDDMMAKCTAEEVVIVFFTSLDQGELNISARAVYFQSPGDLLDFFVKAGEITRVRVERTSPEGSGTVDATVSLAFRNSKRNYSKREKVKLVFISGQGWRVDYSSVASLLTKNISPEMEEKNGMMENNVNYGR